MTDVMDKGLRKLDVTVSKSVLAVITILFGILVIAFPEFLPVLVWESTSWFKESCCLSTTTNWAEARTKKSEDVVARWFQLYSPSPRPITAMPTKASIATITTKTITATTAIANAISQPQSKKCLIRASQITNMMIAATKPPTKAPTIAPITTPRTTIQIASVNLAFSFPTKALQTSHKMGATTIMPTTMLIKRPTISIWSRLLSSYQNVPNKFALFF
jgi:hypothetical protein